MMWFRYDLSEDLETSEEMENPKKVYNKIEERW